jgi:hypothetical protein
MDIPPAHVHQRVPTILGSPLDVLELRRYYESSSDPELIRRCEARMKGLPTTTMPLSTAPPAATAPAFE